MTAIRVILITVAGPAGHVDVGVRSDATAAGLAAWLGTVLGVSPAAPAAEHRSPPRPGEPRGRRVPLRPDVSLAAAGVADGDLVMFGRAGQGSRGQPGRAGRPGQAAAAAGQGAGSRTEAGSTVT